MIAPATIYAVKELDSRDVLGKYLDFNSAHKACCPFHGEKTPSLSAKKNSQVWKCFGCGQGGDPIKFVQEHRKLTFPEAVEEIAKDHGIRIEKENVDPQREAERLSREEEADKILNWAQKKFAKALQELPADSPEGKYIHGRFTPEQIADWGIGYAPKDFNFLTPALIDKNHYDMAIELGIIKTKDGTSDTRDHYYHRMIIPIHNAKGKLQGFAARALDATGEKYGKWWNPNDSFVYKKESSLFGLHKAKEAIQKNGIAQLMEGYGDVITAHTFGLTNTVASCGTSITEGQLQVLKKDAHTLALMLDGDEAGLKATEKTIHLALAIGLHTTVVEFPQGQDPEDYIKEVAEMIP